MKNETNHTPGPWKVSGACYIRPANDGQWLHELIVVTQDDFNPAPSIATVNCRAYVDSEKEALKPDPEALANARLIAAAPETAAERDRLKEVNAELLQLCETILIRLDMEHSEQIAKGVERPAFMLSAIRGDLRSAITRAKGEPTA